MVAAYRPDRTGLATRFILLLMAQALLLPIYGPWLDREFAARQADHKHIYTGKVDLHHHYDHPGHGRHALPTGNQETADTTVSLPNLDVAKQGQALLRSLSEILSFILAAARDSSLVFTLTDHTRASQGISIPPPSQPPRLAR